MSVITFVVSWSPSWEESNGLHHPYDLFPHGEESKGLHRSCRLGVPKRGGIKWATSPLPSRGPQDKMIEMGYITRAVPGSPSGEESNEFCYPCRLRLPKWNQMG